MFKLNSVGTNQQVYRWGLSISVQVYSPTPLLLIFLPSGIVPSSFSSSFPPFLLWYLLYLIFFLIVIKYYHYLPCWFSVFIQAPFVSTMVTAHLTKMDGRDVPNVCPSLTWQVGSWTSLKIIILACILVLRFIVYMKILQFHLILLLEHESMVFILSVTDNFI